VEASEGDSDMEENESVKATMSTLCEVFELREVCKHLMQAEKLKVCRQGFSLLHQFFWHHLKVYFYRRKRNEESALLYIGVTQNKQRHARGNIMRARFHPSKTAICLLLKNSSM
jgi:hypothetical protein